MKLENSDLLKLAENNNYNLIFEPERVGIQPNRPAIFFPSAIDKFLNEQSDSEGIYWIPRKGNEQILADVQALMWKEEPYKSDNEKRMIFKVTLNKSKEMPNP